MIYFVKGQTNRLTVRLNPAVTIAGFSLKLYCCGTEKTVSLGATAKVAMFDFSAAETAEMVSGEYGRLELIDSSNKVYLTYLPQFTAVEEAEAYKAANGGQELNITVPTTFEYAYQFAISHGGGGGGSTEGAVMKSDLKTIANPPQSIKGCQSAINSILALGD